MVDLAYLLAGLLLFPLLGSAASLFVRTRPGAHWPVIISLGLSWLCAALLTVQQVSTSRSFELSLGTWLQSGSLQLTLGFLIDPLSVTLIATITTVTLVGLLYYAGSVRPIRMKTAGKTPTTAPGQIDGDETVGGTYPALVGVIAFFALLAVTGDSYFTLYAGWEGVAVCTWLLMSWRTQRLGATTFAIHRVGSAALVLSILLIVAHAGRLDFAGLAQLTPMTEPIPAAVWTAALLLLAIAAMVQTAQFPFHIWLEDGSPEHPVTSITVQAGATVPIGLYLLLRSQNLFSHSGDAALLVTVVGLGGACLMAIATLGATDTGRALAYSTSSQAGLIMAAIPLTACAWGAVHLVSHSFAKSGLILGAAVVCRAVTSGGDLARMGGLRTHLPLAFWVFVVAGLVLSGIPPFLGFWEYAGMALAGDLWSQALMALTLLLTSLYVWRLLWLVFLGKARSTTLRPAQGRQTPPLATAAITIVSILALSAGGVALLFPLLPTKRTDLLEWGPLVPSPSSLRFLDGGPQTIVIATVAAIGLLGLAIAWLTIRQSGVHLLHEKEQGPLRRLLAGGYYGMEVYELAMSGLRGLGRGLWTFVDTLFFDLLCSRGPAALLATGGWLMARLHTGQIAWYLFAVAAVVSLCTLWLVTWGS